VGRSVLGSDLADLAVAGHGMLPVNISPADIDAAVFDAYLAGGHEAGWPADRNLTRFAYATFAALKYGCLLVWLRDVPNEQRHGIWERVSGQRMDVMLGQQAVMLEHRLGLLDEARRLVEVI
jgi:hypothetical protein